MEETAIARREAMELDTSTMAQAVARLEQAQAALDAATTPLAAKSVSDAIYAVVQWLKMQTTVGLDLKNNATALMIKAQAKLGALTASMEKNRGGWESCRSTMLRQDDDPPTYADLGINRVTATRYRHLANLTAEAIDRMAKEKTAEGKILTQKAVLDVARGESEQSEPRDPKPVMPPAPKQIGPNKKAVKISLTWDFMDVATRIFNHYTPGELSMLLARINGLKERQDRSESL